MDAGCIHPCAVDQRTSQEMVALSLTADQPAAQRGHVRQVKVVPINLAIVHTLKTGIKTAAHMDNDWSRISLHIVPRLAVKLPAAQDNGNLGFLSYVGQDAHGIDAHLPDRRHRILIIDEGIGPLRFHGSNTEWNQHRVSYIVQAWVQRLGHGRFPETSNLVAMRFGAQPRTKIRRGGSECSPRRRRCGHAAWVAGHRSPVRCFHISASPRIDYSIVGGLRRDQTAGVSRLTGKDMVNLVPCPRLLATVMVPPWLSTIERAIASPRPASPLCAWRDLSPR